MSGLALNLSQTLRVLHALSAGFFPPGFFPRQSRSSRPLTSIVLSGPLQAARCDFLIEAAAPLLHRAEAGVGISTDVLALVDCVRAAELARDLYASVLRTSVRWRMEAVQVGERCCVYAGCMMPLKAGMLCGLWRACCAGYGDSVLR